MIAMPELAARAAAPEPIRCGSPARTVVVAGPRGAGKTRWIQQCIREVLAERPASRCAVLLAEEGRTRMEAFCAQLPSVTLGKLYLPCLCCPAAADLPQAIERLSRIHAVDSDLSNEPDETDSCRAGARRHASGFIRKEARRQAAALHSTASLRFNTETGADWLFLELPVVAAPGLLAEFDRHVGGPRAVVMRLTPAWAKALQSGVLSPFQSGMLDVADAVITTAGEAERGVRLILSRGAFVSLPS